MPAHGKRGNGRTRARLLGPEDRSGVGSAGYSANSLSPFHQTLIPDKRNRGSLRRVGSRTLPHQRCGFAILSNHNQKVKPVIANRFEKAGRQAGADTTLQNAECCGAEFSWVPMGYTCSFCRMLASNGWQRQSKQAMKGGHAEHIHANCDCQYAVRFDGKGGVAGYDPDKYKAEYDAAEGTTWQEKLNSMRREQYKANKDEINAQKRIAYNERVRKGKLPNVDLEEYGLSFTDNTKPYYPPDTIMAGKGCKTGRKIDDIDRLVEAYSEFNAGAEEWSKRKARYEVEDIYGQIHEIEVHWYQHPNVGKCEDKIKLDDYGNPFVDEWDL